MMRATSAPQRTESSWWLLLLVVVVTVGGGGGGGGGGFVLHLNLTRCYKQQYSREFGILHGLPCLVNILLSAPRQAANNRHMTINVVIDRCISNLL
ncbi:hypothetical protein L6452_29746 [Arctium lappa]|uniref:Uncharacterized protein n=1 Tax=Arctium lappa TaxID=4217 RepID=A0ACB8ZGE4_ARCLA|nr:hypothetical protein L6452_29746 [Arctium lappa]